MEVLNPYALQEFHKELHKSEQQASKKTHEGIRKIAEVDINVYRGYYTFAMEVLRLSPFYLGHSLPHILCPWNDEMQASDPVKSASLWLYDNRSSQNMVAAARLSKLIIQLFCKALLLIGALSKVAPPAYKHRKIPLSASSSSDPKGKRPMSEIDLFFLHFPQKSPNDAKISMKKRKRVTFCRMIPIFERRAHGDKKLAEVNIDICRGYYTFAREIRRVCPYNLGNSLPHIRWPWAPRYYAATYYWTDKGSERPLDPLDFSWDVFSSKLEYVVMYPDLGGFDLIALTVQSDTQVLWNLRIPRWIVSQSYNIFRRVVYYYYQAHIGLEPGTWEDMPDEIWPQAHCWYIDAEDYELNFPGDNKEKDCAEGEVVISAEEGGHVHEAGDNKKNDGEAGEKDTAAQEEDLDKAIDGDVRKEGTAAEEQENLMIISDSSDLEEDFAEGCIIPHEVWADFIFFVVQIQVWIKPTQGLN